MKQSPPILRYAALPKGRKGALTDKNCQTDGTWYLRHDEVAATTAAELIEDLYRLGYHSAEVVLRGNGATTVIARISPPDEFGRRTTWFHPDHQPTTEEQQ